MSSTDAIQQFINPNIRSLPDMGRAIIQGVEHRLQWNENPFDYPAPLKEEVLRRMSERPWSYYPDGLRPYGLIDVLAQHLGVPATMVVVGPGSAGLIRTTMAMLLQSGEHMAMPSPTFLLYRRTAHMLGVHAHEIPTTPDNNFALPTDDLIVSARTNEVKLVVLCAPNNPTGTIYPMQDLRRVVEESGAIVLIDAAYTEFCDQDLLPLVSEFDNVILLRTFSKAYALAGMRIGYAVASPILAAQLQKTVDVFTISTFSETVAAVALENMDQFQPSIELLTQERDRLADTLGALPGVQVFPSGTNFLLVRLDRPERALLEDCRNRYKMAISDMAGYPELSGYVRVSVGTPAQNKLVVEAVARFAGGGGKE